MHTCVLITNPFYRCWFPCTCVFLLSASMPQSSLSPKRPLLKLCHLFVPSVVKFHLWPSLFQHCPLLPDTTLHLGSSHPSAFAPNPLCFPLPALLMLSCCCDSFPSFSHCKYYTGTGSTATTVPPRAGWQLPLRVCSLLFPFTHFMQHLAQWAPSPPARHLKHCTECKYNHMPLEVVPAIHMNS